MHLTYQTAFVDDDGKLQIRRDVYGLDARTIAAVKSERAMVDPKEERAKEMSANSTGRRSAQALSPFQRGGSLLEPVVRRLRAELRPAVSAAPRHPLSEARISQTGAVPEGAAPVNYFTARLFHGGHFSP